MNRVPFAASTRWPAQDQDKAGSFSSEGMEDPDQFRVSDADEEARRSRLAAPPMQKPAVTGEERDRLIAGCADAVLVLSPLIHGAGDALVRRLAEEIGITVEEADAIVAQEFAARLVGIRDAEGRAPPGHP